MFLSLLRIFLGECPPYRDQDGAKHAGHFFMRLVHDRNKVQMELTRIYDAEFRKFQASPPPPRRSHRETQCGYITCLVPLKWMPLF